MQEKITDAVTEASPHNVTKIFYICLFLGVFGVHRFIIGKPITGLLMLCTFGGMGFWWMIDTLLLVFVGTTDGEGRNIDNHFRNYAKSKAGTDMESVANEPSPEQPKRGSSKTAKAAFAMSAVAYAKSSGPSKVPTVYCSDGGAKNINWHHKKGDKWLVTYEELHPSVGWQRGKKEIRPGISGWNVYGGNIRVSWDKI